MKTNVIKTLLSVAVLSALIGCDKDKETVVVQMEAKKLVAVNTDAMSAEELARAGEQLIGPQSFMYAYSIFGEALKKDPTNFRAQFYKHLLGRAMVLKGIAKSGRTIAQKYGSAGKWDESFNSIPNSGLRDFLFADTKKLETGRDVQNILIEYREAGINFYKFLKANQANEFVVYLNPLLFKDATISNTRHTCVLRSQADMPANSTEPLFDDSRNLEFECNIREAYQRKLNVADLLAIRLTSALDVLYSLVPTSYSMDGLEKIYSGASQAKGRKLTVDDFRNLPGFGDLLSNQGMHFIETLASDSKIVWQWYKDNKDALCAKGKESNEAYQYYGILRPGYLFDQGFCTDQEEMNEFDQIATIIDQALGGAINLELQTTKANKKQTSINPLAISRDPVKNILDLAPKNSNSCKPQENSYWSKIFPRNDAGEFIEFCTPTNDQR